MKDFYLVPIHSDMLEDVEGFLYDMLENASFDRDLNRVEIIVPTLKTLRAPTLNKDNWVELEK